MSLTSQECNKIDWKKFSSSVEGLTNLVVFLRAKGVKKPLSGLEEEIRGSLDRGFVDEKLITLSNIQYLKGLISSYNTTTDKKTKFVLNQTLKRMKIL